MLPTWAAVAVGAVEAAPGEASPAESWQEGSPSYLQHRGSSV